MKNETDHSFAAEAAMLAENLTAISEKLRIAQQELRMLQRLYTTAHAACPGGGCCGAHSDCVARPAPCASEPGTEGGESDGESKLDWCLRVPDFCEGKEKEANEND